MTARASADLLANAQHRAYSRHWKAWIARTFAFALILGCLIGAVGAAG